MKIAPGTLMALFPSANPVAIDTIARGAGTFERYGINTPLRMAHFLAQIAHETGGLRVLEENGNYTNPDRLRAIFPRQFPTLSCALDYAGNAERILNRAYANIIGNGDEMSGDGFRFRGRGFIQITGRHNYTDYGKRLDVDLVENPDQAKVGDTALKIACLYWDRQQLNKYADIESFEAVRTVSRGVNLGNPRSTKTPNGLEDRYAEFQRVYDALREFEPKPEIAPAPEVNVNIPNIQFPAPDLKEIDWAIGGSRLRAVFSAIKFAVGILFGRLAR